ncbi:hypothetical protein [Flavobacterium sp.]|uniref:hypothetical protein n=1 Tax=Flavobacterium sp. TaxID=239 RepID=UPI0040349F36
MISQSNDRRDLGDQGGQTDKWHVNDYSMMPYDDPALVNPDELATFPKAVRTDVFHPLLDHELHTITKRTPVRDGRNITRTDNHPDKNGFM